LVIPALNDGLRLGARCLVGGVAPEARLHVEPPRPTPILASLAPAGLPQSVAPRDLLAPRRAFSELADTGSSANSLDCVIFDTPVRSIMILLNAGEAMAQRDITAREDRLIGLCLAAAAILLVFIFIVTYS
jgi:hypothetical protein